MSADFDALSMLADLPPEEQTAALMEMFFPYDNEQATLNHEQALAQQLRQRGPERGSPGGALFGGLANVIGGTKGAFMQEKGLKDQRALGARAQEDATSRFKRLFQAMTQPRPSMPMDELDMPIPLS